MAEEVVGCSVVAEGGSAQLGGRVVVVVVVVVELDNGDDTPQKLFVGDYLVSLHIWKSAYLCSCASLQPSLSFTIVQSLLHDQTRMQHDRYASTTVVNASTGPACVFKRYLPLEHGLDDPEPRRQAATA